MGNFRIVAQFVIAATVVSGLAMRAEAADSAKPSAANLTCAIHGGSFAMDDNDFKAVFNAGVNDTVKIKTKGEFAALSEASPLRQQICATRLLWRLIRDGYAEYFDLTTYKEYQRAYFNGDELGKVNEFLAASATKCGK